jgi:NAD(P)-dependent dehydrogenase (short-subunit alcohol dehydrogenase family)
MTFADGQRMGGRVAMVFGGGNGVGESTCELLASEGARVLIADISEHGAVVAENIRARGGEAIFVATDVTSSAMLDAAVARCIGEWGAPHTVVHSVYQSLRAPVAELAEADWDATVDVVLKSGFLAARAVVPAIVAAGGGSLTFISSIEATFGHPSEPAYAAAKAGLGGLARQIAVDYGPRHVRANCILPGQVIVERNRARIFGEPGLAERRAECYPLRRLAVPSDIARVVLFLASDDAAFVTGVSLPVDGGVSAQAATVAADAVYTRFGMKSS